ncbi:MAG TPA: DUF6089 family protein [Cyclobacteriaceae bacterium]|nr:DUF6089 family protein [Cyclobacteriaceae bacterium]
MHRILILIVIAYSISFLSATDSVAQRSEAGFGLGTLNYTGDLARTYNFLNSRPAGTVYYRNNISSVISARAAGTFGKLGASDQRPIDAFATARDASFNIFLFETSAVFEYHFLDWRDFKRKLFFTPYLFAGFGIFGISGDIEKNAEYSNVQPAIPFGVGFKYNVNPKWYVSLEFGVRKTFFDYLDNISEGDQTIKNYQYGNRYSNDNYFFLGFSLTHTFYEIPCPKNP